MRNLFLVIALSSLVLAGCDNKTSEPLSCTEYSVSCEKDKDYQLVRVDSIDMPETDSYGLPLEKSKWYVRVKSTWQYLPIPQGESKVNANFNYSRLNRFVDEDTSIYPQVLANASSRPRVAKTSFDTFNGVGDKDATVYCTMILLGSSEIRIKNMNATPEPSIETPGQ